MRKVETFKAAGPIIMGVDPGSRHTGYGLIRSGPAGVAGATLLASGRLSPPASWPLPRRLAYLCQGLTELMAGDRPEAVAVESLFAGPNPRSLLILAQARGVALLAAAQAGAEVFEYSPREVKNAVSGYGQAEKSQVAWMAARLLGAREELSPDAADALALAICHAERSRSAGRPPAAKGRGWRDCSEADLVILGLGGAPPSERAGR